MNIESRQFPKSGCWIDRGVVIWLKENHANGGAAMRSRWTVKSEKRQFLAQSRKVRKEKQSLATGTCFAISVQRFYPEHLDFPLRPCLEVLTFGCV
jgi:hypothetical protein